MRNELDLDSVMISPGLFRKASINIVSDPSLASTIKSVWKILLSKYDADIIPVDVLISDVRVKTNEDNLFNAL
jgi:hypothetical protein